jgi:hypothetical protein
VDRVQHAAACSLNNSLRDSPKFTRLNRGEFTRRRDDGVRDATAGHRSNLGNPFVDTDVYECQEDTKIEERRPMSTTGQRKMDSIAPHRVTDACDHFCLLSPQWTSTMVLPSLGYFSPIN